jgi:hypothetical protein
MNVEIIDIVTIVAIIVGPIAAVIVTRAMDERNAKNVRRHAIFRDLMRTRSAKLSLEHVTALNLVEIEFYENSGVRSAWQKYMENLSSEAPEDRAQDFYGKRDQLFIKLLQEVANQIGLKKVDITDLMTSNYYPQGWANDEVEQRKVRALLIQTLSGMKPLRVRMQDERQWDGPFPPFAKPDATTQLVDLTSQDSIVDSK